MHSFLLLLLLLSLSLCHLSVADFHDRNFDDGSVKETLSQNTTETVSVYVSENDTETETTTTTSYNGQGQSDGSLWSVKAKKTQAKAKAKGIGKPKAKAEISHIPRQPESKVVDSSGDAIWAPHYYNNKNGQILVQSFIQQLAQGYFMLLKDAERRMTHCVNTTYAETHHRFRRSLKKCQNQKMSSLTSRHGMMQLISCVKFLKANLTY